jgi:hypothetical protein
MLGKRGDVVAVLAGKAADFADREIERGEYNYSPSRGMISLIVTTIDTDAELRPLAHINVGSKCSWYSIADELPQFRSTPSAAEFGQLRTSAATANADGRV